MRVNAVLAVVLASAIASSGAQAQAGPAAPKLAQRAEAGKTWTQEEVIGNIYYVGTRSLASFLLTTTEGHILINTNSKPACRASRTRREARLHV